MADNPYESDKLVSEYLLFHYGSAEEILPPAAPPGMAAALDFAVRTADAFEGPGERGLDLGCAQADSLPWRSDWSCGVSPDRASAASREQT